MTSNHLSPTQVHPSLWRTECFAGGMGGCPFDHLHASMDGWDAATCRICAIDVFLYGDFIRSFHVSYTGPIQFLSALETKFRSFEEVEAWSSGRLDSTSGYASKSCAEVRPGRFLGPAASSSGKATVSAGGKGGSPTSIQLSEQEVIVSVFGVCISVWDSRKWANALGFKIMCTATGEERVVTCGYHWHDAHGCFSARAPTGFCIAGFHGRHGGLIDRIGVYISPIPGLMRTPDLRRVPRTLLPPAFLRDARNFLLARRAGEGEGKDLGRLGGMEREVVLRHLLMSHLKMGNPLVHTAEGMLERDAARMPF